MPKYLHQHIDIIKWKHFPRYWSFVRGNHRSPVNSPHKGQWRGALMFSLICVSINDWVNNREAGDLRHHRVNYDVTVMKSYLYKLLVRKKYHAMTLHPKFINIKTKFRTSSWALLQTLVESTLTDIISWFSINRDGALPIVGTKVFCFGDIYIFIIVDESQPWYKCVVAVLWHIEFHNFQRRWYSENHGYIFGYSNTSWWIPMNDSTCHLGLLLSRRR